MRFLIGLLLTVMVLGVALGSAGAQTPPALPMLAAVTNGNLTIYGAGDAPLIGDDTLKSYFQVAWSPDGQKLAYIGIDAQDAPVLKVIDLSQSVRLVLTRTVLVNFPLNFTSDSQRIIYAAPSKTPAPETENPQVYIDLAVQDILEGSLPELVGTFPFGVGCSGGSPFPGDLVYGAEGGGFLSLRVVLKPVPGGIVYSRDCTGLSTAVYSPSAGRGYFLKEPIMQAVVSPNQLEVAGTTLVDGQPSPQILIGTTDGQGLIVLPTSSEVERVAWTPTGDALYYSSRQRVGAIPLSEVFINAVQWETTEIPTFQVSLYRVSRADSTETLLYQGAGYAIGRIIVTPDPNILLFTVVPNADGWVASVEAGLLTKEQADYWQQSLAQFPVELYQLDQSTGAVTLLGTGFQQTTLNRAQWGQ